MSLSGGRSPQSVRNEWSSQSSIGSSSSGSWSRASGLQLNDKSDVIHCERFRDFAQHLEKGLSECISCIENDLLINKSSNSWKVNNDSRELQQYVAHKDSLRQQLAKVTHLRDQYENNIRLREALIKMIKISKSRDCDNEWRENARILIGIEKQLQLMIGIFHFNVEAIEGWARICVRDQYEIEFRFGNQRRLVRVKIGRDGQREWDSQEFTFRATLLESVIVRVREVKSGWTKRYVTLGVSHIETRDLMRSRSQVMSLLANCSGSLKLRVRVKWTPAISSYFNNNNNIENNNSIQTLVINEPLEETRAMSRSPSREGILESLSSLMSCLEDFQGQYEELVPMNAAVNRLWKVISRDSSPHFNDDEDVDAALAEFGFLDDNNDDQNNTVISRAWSPVSISSEWQKCVLTHSRDAITQLSACGAWVLKAREKDALNRLTDDAFALNELGLNFGHNFDSIFGQDLRVKQFWNLITNEVKRDVIIVDCRPFADSLSVLMHSFESNQQIITNASEWLTANISECDFVTLLHVRAFWMKFESRVSCDDILKVALDTSRLIAAKESSVFESLLSRFVSRDWTPREVTWAVARAMISGDHEISKIAVQWIEIETQNNRNDIIMHLLSGLESHSSTTRRASCHALAHIRAIQTIEQLLHVSTEDNDSRVRDDARKALLTFGGEAEARWQQCSLTQMGFTGLSIDHKNRAKI